MKFDTAHLIVALSRGAVEWLFDPRTRRHVLRSRCGLLYEARAVSGRFCLVRISSALTA